jgi:hypothetical protein
MALLPSGLGFNTSDSSNTSRQGSQTLFPRQFLLDYHNTFGGPFTVNDLFQMAPRGRSLFGNANQGSMRPGGGFNLGFGAPTQPASGSAEPPRFSLNDLQDAYADDPEKKMDLDRLFKGSDVDPNSFTLDEFQDLSGKAKDKGFSGRSRGNFNEMLSILMQKGDLSSVYGGGKGTGIF